MNERDLIRRTKRFALDVIELVGKLPDKPAGRVLGNQLLRAGTSVGANYRAACKGRSLAEFISKLGNVEEEADESIYWLELMDEAAMGEKSQVKALMNEAHELTAIMAASRKTAKGKL